MEEPKEGIIDLIQKCLNLGKSPNEHEAQLAMSKAQELLEKYNLTLADLRPEEQSSHINMISIPVPIGNSEWKRRLISYIAQQSFCKVVISGKSVYVLGRSSNVYSTLVMASWVVAQLENIAWLETTTYSGPLQKLKFRDSFLWGAINWINERLKEERGAREQVNPNLKALVVNLSTETSQFTRIQFPHLSSHHVGKSFSGEAYQKGRAAGDRISLYGGDRQLQPNRKLLN